MAFFTQTIFQADSINEFQPHNSANIIPLSIKFRFSHLFYSDLFCFNLGYIASSGFLCLLIFGLGLFKATLDTAIFFTSAFVGLAALFLFLSFKLINNYFKKVQTKREFKEIIKRLQNNDAGLVISHWLPYKEIRRKLKAKGKRTLSILECTNRMKIDLVSLDHQNQIDDLRNSFVSNQQNQLFLFDYQIEFSIHSNDSSRISLMIQKFKQKHHNSIQLQRSNLKITYQIQGVDCCNLSENNFRKDIFRMLGYVFAAMGLLLPYMAFFHFCIAKKQQIKIRKNVCLK